MLMTLHECGMNSWCLGSMLAGELHHVGHVMIYLYTVDGKTVLTVKSSHGIHPLDSKADGSTIYEYLETQILRI